MDQLLQQLIVNTTGFTNVGDTVQNKGQCVGLVEVWLDMLGLNINHLYGNAVDLPTNASPNLFSVIVNTTNNFPSPGDIVTLGEPYGLVSGVYYGHCGVCITADINSMVLLEQNDPDGSTPQQKVYNYSAQNIKWLHPLSIPALQTTTILNTYGLDPTNIASEQVVYDTWHKASQGLLVDVGQLNTANQTIEDLQKQILDLQSNHNEDQKEIVNLNSSLAALSSSNKDYASQAMDAEKIANTYIGYMDDFAQTAGIDPKGQTDQEIHDEIIKEMVAANQNQKTPEGSESPEEVQSIWQTKLKNVVNWLLKNGFKEFLNENNLHVVDNAGNFVDDAVDDRVIAYLDDRFNHIAFLENALVNAKTQIVKGKNLFEQFLGLFYKSA